MALYQPPTQNALQFTLDSQIAAGATSLTLNSSVTGIVQAPGVLVIDRIDSSNNSTPSKREYKTFTGVSGANITGLAGGLAGSTDQIHAVGAIVEFVPDVIQQQAIYDTITTEHTTGGVHTSLASIGQIRALNIVGWSTASLQLANVRALAVASLASLQQVWVADSLNVSGASLSGIFPSGASGGVLTSYGNDQRPVFAPAGGVTDPLYMNNLGVASLASISVLRTFTHLNASGASTSGSFFRSKVITSSRDLSAATGNVAYTGVGFTPSSIVANMAATGNQPYSQGYSDSSKAASCLAEYGTGNLKTTQTGLLYLDVDGANNKQVATVSSYDTDGFTLTWTKTGSPTGTYTLVFTCFG